MGTVVVHRSAVCLSVFALLCLCLGEVEVEVETRRVFLLKTTVGLLDCTHTHTHTTHTHTIIFVFSNIISERKYGFEL